jgi:hypothetical protein
MMFDLSIGSRVGRGAISAHLQSEELADRQMNRAFAIL